MSTTVVTMMVDAYATDYFMNHYLSRSVEGQGEQRACSENLCLYTYVCMWLIT